MAQPTNTYATNDMVGIREDLSNIIYNLSPTETPFMSLAGRTEASNTLHEWQVDSLAAAADNAAIEGDDAVTDACTPTVRRGNYTQISDKVARVSGTAQAVNTAGRANEMDYQVLKKGKELKRDMETACLANQAKVAGDDATARRLAGVPAWIYSNTDFGATGADPAGTGANARTDGTQRALTEDQVKTVLQERFNNASGNDATLMTGSFNRQVASSFTAGKTGFQKSEDKTLHATYDVYASDFGNLTMVPNRFMRARDALILEMEYWKVAFLPGRNMVTFDLAKTGDTVRKQILSEYTVEACNEAASAIVADLTAS